MSDNLLCSVIRAWDTDSNIDGKKKIIAVAPAMNSVTSPPLPPTLTSPPNIVQAMWRHPITAKQIRVLAEDWGVKEEPIPAPEGDVGSSEGEGWFQVIRVCLPLLVALA